MSIAISYIMAAFNTAPYIGEAIESVLAQSVEAIELIIADDGSTDGTLAIAEAAAARDPRVVVLAGGTGSGPSAARNRAMAAAHGEWIAIIDSDDLIAPNRSQELLDLAASTCTEIIADNIERFTDGSGKTLPALFEPGTRPYSFSIDATSYLKCNTLIGRNINLGYLKPMFRRSFLRENGIVYAESVRVGEDFDFCLACLLHGAQFLVTSQAWYRYRIREGSLSWRLKVSDVDALILAHERMMKQHGEGQGAEFRKAADIYVGGLKRALAFSRLVEAIKVRKWRLVFSLLMHRIDLLVPLFQSIFANISRRFTRPAQVKGL